MVERFLACAQGLLDKNSEKRMNSKSLFNACLILTVLCGIGTVGLAIVMSMHPGSETHLVPVLTTLTSLFGLGASAFFFKGLGG